MTKNIKCPLCNQPVVAEFNPFCSKKCKNEDFLNWTQGRYRFQSEEEVINESTEELVEKE